jgi:2,4-dienoyl-CoA reductase-like NADH-dependent reductase (Old Yellow Enzyme family)/thioredoxin reductase
LNVKPSPKNSKYERSFFKLTSTAIRRYEQGMHWTENQSFPTNLDYWINGANARSSGGPMNQLDALFSPITIKNMQAPNRAVLPPMGTGLCNRDGLVSEAQLAFMRRQASSGAGLLISEITAVHPGGVVFPAQTGAWDDRFIPGLQRLAHTMQALGGKAVMQLHHAGRESYYLLKKGLAIGPSAIPSLVYGQAAKEMTLELIDEVITAFGTAAARARNAGFDAVEIHGAHGYLLTQFLSAISNQRTDQYGGKFAERARFVIEVVRSVRKHVGDDFPVILRLSAEEYIKNGYSVDDVITILPDLVGAGVDVIHASVGTHGSPAGITSAPPEFETGFNVWRAEKIKKAAGIPVIAVGRFNDPRRADQVINDGQADMVAFGRQQLCDPDYLKKARAGRYEDIRICIACNQGCIEREMFEAKSIRCAINPETGQELFYPQAPAAVSRQVWIVGAGPAGLTAAYEANRLGHKVTLFEKQDLPGGNILYACKAPHKEIYLDWIQWLVRQVQLAGIEIRTGTQVTESMLAEARPDMVILATGGEKIVPSIPGIDLPHVHDAWEILGEKVPPGKHAMVIGGGLIGMETACFIAARGGAVTLVEQLPSSPVPKFTSHGYTLHKYLRGKDALLRFGCVVQAIEADSVALLAGDRQDCSAGHDQVVLAVGMRPRSELKAYLQTSGIRHVIIGDALKVRRIMEATEEGAQAAWSI